MYILTVLKAVLKSFGIESNLKYFWFYSTFRKLAMGYRIVVVLFHISTDTIWPICSTQKE